MKNMYKKKQDLHWSITAVIWIVCIAIVLGISYGYLWLLTIGTQFAVKGLLDYDLPYWPTLVCIFVLSAIIGGGSRSSK